MPALLDAPELGGNEIIPLSTAAAMLHRHPAALYAAGCRGELRLIRLSPTAWGVTTWELRSMLATAKGS